MTGVPEIFAEVDRHLLEDEAPSAFLSRLPEKPWFAAHPFSMLARLRSTPQSPLHHPEGSAWNHTLLVVDAAAGRKEKSRHPQAFLWAALLHDIGKPDTTKLRRGKLTSYCHETRGAVLARRFLEELGCGAELTDRVVSLVKWHMQPLFVIKGLPFADIPAMRREADVNEVALLGLCDRLGRLGADEQAELRNCRRFLRLVSADLAGTANRTGKPKP